MHHTVDGLIVQLNRIASIDHELRTARGNGTIRIRGAAAWSALLDHRDQLLIRIVSFARGIYKTSERFGASGHFYEIAGSADDRTAFSVGTFDDAFDEEDGGAAELQERRYAERAFAVQKIFARAATPATRVTSEDVVALGRRLNKRTKKVDRMRNMSAHPFEIVGDGFHVDFKRLGAILTEWEQTIAALLLLAAREWRTATPIRLDKPDHEVRDLVDLVIFGSADAMNEMSSSVSEKPYHWQRRTDLYETLRAKRQELGVEAINDSVIFQAMPVKIPPST